MNIESLLKKIDLNLYDIQVDRYQYQGFNVPRVTEILSDMLHEDFLMTWANNIGLYQKKKYKDTLEAAANKGAYVHDAIEDYIQNGNDLDIETVETEYRKEVNYAYGSFRAWWDNLCSKRNVKIVMQEQKLVCPWFGGTLDLLVDIDGRIYLLDFKTSNHASYKYFLQLAAYRYILKYFYGIEIYGCGIIKLNKKYISFEEFIIDKAMKEYEDFMALCETTFLSLVYAYFNRIDVERRYSLLFG